jgi:hypothetical protein
LAGIFFLYAISSSHLQGGIPNRVTTPPTARYTGGLKKVLLQKPEFLQPGEEEAVCWKNDWHKSSPHLLFTSVYFLFMFIYRLEFRVYSVCVVCLIPRIGSRSGSGALAGSTHKKPSSFASSRRYAFFIFIRHVTLIH